MFVYSKFNKNITGDFFIKKQGVFFPFRFDKTTSDKLVVFFPGAYKKDLERPKFQRSSYSNKLDYNCLYLFDPTLFLNDELTLGWFTGTEDLNYTTLLNEIFREMIGELKIEFDNILFFATSAGGITALKVSKNFPNSKVYLGNIQTNIFEYYKGPVRMLLETCFKKYEENDIRFSVLNKPIINNKVFYCQNVLDNFHYENHYLPFFEKNKSDNIEYNLYSHSSKHSPISNDFELRIINRIFNDNTISKLYLELDSE